MGSVVVKMEEKLPKRKEIRLKNYDYSEPGAYFITICTKSKEGLLWKGKPEAQKYDWKLVGAHCVRPLGLPLSKAGIIVEDNLNRLNNTYENVYLSSYVIMPNHIHLIIVILPSEGGRTQCAPTVSKMIKLFKEAVTKQLDESIWQKLFYDHIIRDQRDYEKISKYIFDNPMKWEEDELFYGE